MKVLVTLLLLVVLTLAACAPGAPSEPTQEENNEVEEQAPVENTADTNNNGVADVAVVADEDSAEVTVDFDDVQDEETKEAIEEASGSADFCTPGSTYTYESEDGSVDADIVGLATYKGSEFCQATSTTVIESPVGSITTETTYYFDDTYSEFWIVTSTTGSALPEPQVNEIHLVDGEVV